MLNQTHVRFGIPDAWTAMPVSFDMPPSAALPFYQVDQGQAGPRHVRSTVTAAPASQQMQTESCIPFGFLVQPLAEMTSAEYNNEQSNYGEVPVVDLAPSEDQPAESKGTAPFRCSKCHAYFNVNSLFESNGSKVQCNLCRTVSDVPSEHYGPINQMGKREDREYHPEYFMGTFEYKLADNYIDTPPVKPRYVFCLDISATAIINGFFYQAISTIKQCLDFFQNPEETEVCFCTYDQAIQFYGIAQDPNDEPKIYWVGDVEDPFAPCPASTLMLSLVEDRERIDAFIDRLVLMYHIEDRKKMQI